MSEAAGGPTHHGRPHTIVPFDGKDSTVRDLIGLEKSTFRKHDSWAEELPAMLKKRNVVTMLARDDESGRVIGYLLATSNGLNLHIQKLAVREECRRQGLGRALVQEALRLAAKERKSSSATLHVAVDNIPALTLYRSLGFHDDSLLEDYYKPGRHAIKMLCDMRQDTE